MLTYQFKLYPSKEQQEKLWLHANKLNWLYNYFLAQRIETYEKLGEFISQSEQQHEITELIKTDEVLKSIYGQVRQQVTDRLNKNFRKNLTRLKFRSCKKFFGIVYPQQKSRFWIKDDIFKTKTYGKIKFNKCREIQGNIKQASITNKNDKWYLNIVTDHIKPTSTSEAKCAIDLGLYNIVTTEQGFTIRNQNHFKYFDKKIDLLKSIRDKNHKRKSRKFNKINKTIQKLYGAKSNKSKDFLHKVSKSLSSTYGTIFVEDLNSKKMSESKKTGLNKKLRNSCFSKLLIYLGYKTKTLIKVDPRNTSQTCSSCNHLNLEKLGLYDRTFVCESCGFTLDRDINAAKNIFSRGQATLLQQGALL